MIGFGKFGKLRNTEITSLSDERLMLIDPTVDGFFDKVLQFETDNVDINTYIDALFEVKAAKIAPFWRPVMDPSEVCGSIIYMKGLQPAVGHSYNWWREMAKKMSSVEENVWCVESEYEYYADEVDLINQLVDTKEYELKEAIKMVVLKSSELGHFADSANAKNCFERTGSREVCGRCDLGNTCKILSCTNDDGYGYWKAGGSFYPGTEFSLADLAHHNNAYTDLERSVGNLVLRKTIA